MNPRRHGWLIAQVLVLMVLLGGIPIAASPVIGGQKSAPAFTLDICDPIPVLAVGGASCTLASLPAFSFLVAVADRGPVDSASFTVIDRVSEAPDPPPPKTLA